MELFLRSIQLTVKLVYILVNALLTIIPSKKKQTIPTIKNELLTLSVEQLVQRLKCLKLKSTELVQVYIERIREVDPYINAVVEHRFKEAIRDAEKVDLLINHWGPLKNEELFERYPILGIPFTVKEACGVKDMSHEVGSIARSKMVCKINCAAVENLKLAGGIPLLVSANPEYCFSIETFTLKKVRCLNPYDVSRTCGGSSGGEGALNGCGASLFGIGSDIAGSIRIPSLFNGVFGHKPTGGLISNKGHFPNSDDPKCMEYLQMGPITRFSKDLPLLLKIMAGSKADELDLFTPINTKKIKIFYCLGFSGLNGFLHHRVSLGIQLSIIWAVKHFKKMGLTVVRAKIEQFRNSTEIALTGIARLRNFPYLMKNSSSSPPTVKENLIELFKSIFGYSKYTREGLLFELVRSTNAFMGHKAMVKYESEAQSLKQEIIDLLGSDGVLIIPSFHVTAIHHNTSVLPLWGIDYSLIFNVLGLPCTQVPMGLDGRGLPVGFQVVAAPMRDKLCLQIARELEEAFGGWVPPTEHEFR